MSTQSSDLFSKNIYHLLTELIKLPENKSNTASDLNVDLEDEIQKAMCVIRNGNYIYQPYQPPPPPPANNNVSNN